jgi:hypothetical protein
VPNDTQLSTLSTVTPPPPSAPVTAARPVGQAWGGGAGGGGGGGGGSSHQPAETHLYPKCSRRDTPTRWAPRPKKPHPVHATTAIIHTHIEPAVNSTCGEAGCTAGPRCTTWKGSWVIGCHHSTGVGGQARSVATTGWPPHRPRASTLYATAALRAPSRWAHANPMSD